MSENKIAECYVDISVKTSGLQAKLTAVHSKLMRVQRNFEAISKVGKYAFVALSGVLAGLVDEASKSEDATDNLTQAIQLQTASANQAAIASGKLGQTQQQQNQQTKELTDGLRKYDLNLQKSTTFSRRQIEAFQSMAIASGVNTKSIGSLTKASIGLSQITGQGLTTSFRMLSEAQAGNFGILIRQLPMLKQFKTNQEKLSYVLQVASGGFKMNTAASKTFGGSMTVLKHQLGTVSAALGKQLLPDLKALIKWLSAGVTWFSKLSPATKKWALILVVVATAVAGLLASLPMLISIVGACSTVVGIATAATEMLNAAFVGLDVSTGGLLLAVGAVVAGVVLLISHWQDAVSIAKWCGSTIYSAFKFYFGLVYDVFTGNINGIISKFEALKNWIIGIWDWIDGKHEKANKTANSLAQKHPNAPGASQVNKITGGPIIPPEPRQTAYNPNQFNAPLTSFAPTPKLKLPHVKLPHIKVDTHLPASIIESIKMFHLMMPKISTIHSSFGVANTKSEMADERKSGKRIENKLIAFGKKTTAAMDALEKHPHKNAKQIAADKTKITNATNAAIAIANAVGTFLTHGNTAIKKYQDKQKKDAEAKAKHAAELAHKKEIAAAKHHHAKLHHEKKLAMHKTHISSMSLSAAFEKNQLGSLIGKTSVPHQQLSETKKTNSILMEHLQIAKKMLSGQAKIGVLA